MRKVILNKCYGGFSVSSLGYQKYAEAIGKELFRYRLFIDEEDYHESYIKVDDNYKGIFLIYTTKDYGEQTDNIDISDILDLDERYREDALLIKLVEELGDKINTYFSKLVIVEIPDEVADDYIIDNYDGMESLHVRVKVW